MSTHHYKVLAADDEASILRIYQSLFGRKKPLSPLEQILNKGVVQKQSPALELTTVTQGRDAVEAVRQSLAEGAPFSVVLMDVRMPPGMDGLEASRQILELDPELFLIIVSAYSDYSIEMAEGVLRGNFTLLRKPFNTEALVALVQQQARIWELNQRFARQFMPPRRQPAMAL